MENEEVKNTANSEKTARGENLKPYQFKPGQSGNPSGRPRGTLKDYVRQKLAGMTEEEKEEFLKKINADLIWQMAEGKPQQDVTTGGEKIVIPILNVIPTNNSDNKDNIDVQKDQGNPGGNISE